MFEDQRQVTGGEDKEAVHGGRRFHGALSPALALLYPQASPRAPEPTEP